MQTIYKWDKVFKNGPSKICGRQSLFGPFSNGQMFFILSHIRLTSATDYLHYWQKNVVLLQECLFYPFILIFLEERKAL